MSDFAYCRLALSLLICLLTLSGCGVQKITRNVTLPENISELDEESKYLKAHMLDGNVYVLSEWRVVSSQRFVSGEGKLLGINREIMETGDFTVPIDSVAIFETNDPQVSPAIVAMTVITIASLGVTAYCFANPKACFGSCPTFYIEGDPDSLLQAEGFSASVMPSLEATDVDALFRVVPETCELRIRMTNEALETHVVRYADLLIAEKPVLGRVFSSANREFWQSKTLIEPSRCSGPEGDCLDRVIAFDGVERTSLADSSNLAERETIELEFDQVPAGRVGLVVSSRQSLLTTYLFYQALAYMGSSAAEWIASFERQNHNIESCADRLRMLGGVEVSIQDGDGRWGLVEEFSETGPLATDTKIVPLPEVEDAPMKIRLRFSKGHIRLDYAALAVLGEKMKPSRLRPSAVHAETALDSDATECMLDSAKVLVTYPGDSYTLTYRLPGDFERYELFLESRGYYIEWIRKEWLAEEDPQKLAQLLFNPEEAFRALAPEYKKVESEMEDLFWGSRYAR
jgi:hypothetical protein